MAFFVDACQSGTERRERRLFTRGHSIDGACAPVLYTTPRGVGITGYIWPIIYAHLDLRLRERGNSKARRGSFTGVSYGGRASLAENLPKSQKNQCPVPKMEVMNWILKT